MQRGLGGRKREINGCRGTKVDARERQMVAEGPSWTQERDKWLQRWTQEREKKRSQRFIGGCKRETND